ncbi:PRC-barrel domain containing protein [Bremerella cremea]|uniref:PRC-barrel domain containing protein n=1 Tax=Bremerella cremea TaxID=1031537 RepID=A0A368KM74_9BACT|nr:PRC-barrel domain-containing protein [Bremerella cremea]RCS40737.1 PRC-barrel domain containing protein [Bremerella cremea]
MLVTSFLGIMLAAAMVMPAIADDNTTKNDQEKTVSVDKQKTKDRIAASQVIGASIYGSNQDDTIGSVNDIVMTKDGKVAYLIAGSGGLAGVGETEHAVPAKAFDMKWVKDGDDKMLKLSLPMTAEDLANAPALNLEHASDLTVASFADRNGKYFKSADTKKMSPENMYLVSEIDGLDATGNDNKSVGAIEDIVFMHNDVCKAEYYIIGTGGVVGIGEKYTPVPADHVKVTKTADNQYTASVQADSTIVGAAPKVTSDHYYSELGDKNVRDNVKTAFNEADSK